MALLLKRLFFLSTIVKGWHHFWARWSQEGQERQLTDIHIMVQSLVRTSSFMLKQRENTSQKQAWATTTLFQLQWRTRAAQSWLGLDRSSHLMRWRYFIVTHPPKYKITRIEFNWECSDACNNTQTSNQFLFDQFLVHSSLFLLIRTELISGIRKYKVVKRNLHGKAQRQPSKFNCLNLQLEWFINWLPIVYFLGMDVRVGCLGYRLRI